MNSLNDEQINRLYDRIEQLGKENEELKNQHLRHGNWLPDKTMNVYWICSNCGFPSEAHGAFKLYKYCPNCGAKMDEEKEGQ